MPNYIISDALNLLHDMGVRTTVNNIIGFPKETRELVFDTIRLNRSFKTYDRSVCSFVPFQGTPLRKLTDSLGHVIDFKNTIIIMTSNIGTQSISSTKIGFVDKKGPILPFTGIVFLIATATLIASLGGPAFVSIPLYYICLGASLGMSAVVMNIIWVKLYGVKHIGSI